MPVQKEMRKKLLFVNQLQFGYHIDYFKYCRYLKADIDITYICWDYLKDRIYEEGINVIYIPRAGNLIQRNINFLKFVLKNVKDRNYECIFVNHFRGCSFIPLIYKRKYWIHLGIVSGSVSRNYFARKLYNTFLRFESYFFNSVSVISGGLKKLLKVPANAYILPLGADPLPVKRQPDNRINLLYIGTLTNRRIQDTVIGLGIFKERYNDADIHYDIIGDGWGNEKELLGKIIRTQGLENQVKLRGYIPHNELDGFLARASAGISYIPVTPYYEYQPATKTFEYLMAGIPVIATSTYENKKVISGQNGVIIDDNPESFAHGLEQLYNRRSEFVDEMIRESVADYRWETIVRKLKDQILNFNEILLINQRQFGYHINFYKYCRYLKQEFKITYICWDYGGDKITEEGINVIYVPRIGRLAKRNIRFLKEVLRTAKGKNYQSIIISYFRGCSLIPLSCTRKKRVHLNIVSGSVSKNSVARRLYNDFLHFESRFFKSVSVISEGLKELLRIRPDAYILPLGADPLTVKREPDHRINLIYVGTLTNRRIQDTVAGLSIFHGKHKDVEIHYDIIGDGWGDEKDQIREIAREFELNEHVELKGYIPHNDLIHYLAKADIGISYIPVTPYYEIQPATKTFEYLLAGIPVIATGTFENKRVINDRNGIIIDDNPEGFANGLEQLLNKMKTLDAEIIKQSAAEYKWENIVAKLKDTVIKVN